MAKYCSNCGKELPDEAMYCPDCGKKFIPRSKADFPENYDDLNDSSSDYEFNGPFGPSSKKFEGPFGPHSNRGSNNSNDVNSHNNDDSYNSNDSLNTSNNDGLNSPFSQSSKNQSVGDKLSELSNRINNISPFKMCCMLFIVLMIASSIVAWATLDDRYESDTYDSSVLSDSANDINNSEYKFNNRNNFAQVDSDTNGSYNLPIGKNAYIGGRGDIQLIDSNHSYNVESENFNITEYETYYVSIDDDEWYIIDIFKIKFNTLSQNKVYATDYSAGDPIITYGDEGSYYGYGILIPNSSNNATYKNTSFLESIFHSN